MRAEGISERMCGIVGLFCKDETLQPQLGSLLSGMLAKMVDRGPDSAGFAVYSVLGDGGSKLTVQADDASAFDGLAERLSRAAGAAIAVTRRGSHAVLSGPDAAMAELRAQLSDLAPDLRVVGAGAAMEIYKDVGDPAAVARRFGLAEMAGTHAIGHTRMATESSVTTRGAHPSFHRPRRVPRPQRLAVQPQQSAPPAGA